MIQKLNTDEEVREIYRLRQQTEFGFISEKNIAVQKAKEEGRCEGEKIGIEKGKAEGEKIGVEAEKKKMAKNLLGFGLSVEQISGLTCLTPEEIENLK